MRSKFFGLLVCLAALGIGTGSCRHEADEVCNPTTMLIAKPSDQFRVMWELIDKGYVFFADDATDWDAVYRDFYPQFVELDSCDIIPSAKLQELYSKATETLIDHHMTIQVTNYWAPAEERDKAQGNPTVVVNPASVHLKQRPDYHPALTAAQRNTLFEDTYTAMEANGTMTHRMTGLNNMFLTYARIDGDIVYLQFNTFLIAMELRYGTGHHQSYTNARGEVIPVNYSPTDAFKAYLADLRRADIKGLVIDVRENGGGDLSDLGLLVGTLINEETTVGYTRTKQGLGRLDLSPWTPLVVSPHELSKGTRKDVPVVMLVNLYSASMAEITPMSMRCREGGCYVIGERTYGANGPLLSEAAPIVTYGIPASSMDKSVVCSSSTCEHKDIHGEIHEGEGIMPDLEVAADTAKARQGHDPQIEAAIKYIRSK